MKFFTAVLLLAGFAAASPIPQGYQAAAETLAQLGHTIKDAAKASVGIATGTVDPSVAAGHVGEEAAKLSADMVGTATILAAQNGIKTPPINTELNAVGVAKGIAAAKADGPGAMAMPAPPAPMAASPMPPMGASPMPPMGAPSMPAKPLGASMADAASMTPASPASGMSGMGM